MIGTSLWATALRGKLAISMSPSSQDFWHDVGERVVGIVSEKLRRDGRPASKRAKAQMRCKWREPFGRFDI